MALSEREHESLASAVRPELDHVVESSVLLRVYDLATLVQIGIESCTGWVTIQPIPEVLASVARLADAELLDVTVGRMCEVKAKPTAGAPAVLRKIMIASEPEASAPIASGVFQ
jgi:hypothetical protein